MVRWLRWHCPPDTGFEIRALAVWGRARYLSVTEAPHNTNFHTWMGKKQFFCFFQTAETGNRTPDSGVKGSGANHYPKASLSPCKASSLPFNSLWPLGPFRRPLTPLLCHITPLRFFKITPLLWPLTLSDAFQRPLLLYRRPLAPPITLYCLYITLYRLPTSHSHLTAPLNASQPHLNAHCRSLMPRRRLVFLTPPFCSLAHICRLSDLLVAPKRLIVAFLSLSITL